MLCRRERRRVHANWNDGRFDAMRARQTMHVFRADRYPRREAQCCAHGKTVAPSSLQAVIDLRIRYELAAVERDEARNTEAAAGESGGEPSRQCPVGVNHVEWPIAAQRTYERAVLSPEALRTSEIVHGGAEQRVRARAIVISQDVDDDLVPARLALDEREQSGDDPLASASIDAARDHECYAHSRVPMLIQIIHDSRFLICDLNRPNQESGIKNQES